MEKQSREELVRMYRPDVEKMCLFLPWLKNKTGNDVTSSFDGTDSHKTMAIPVYDSILLEFLNELGSTVFMNQNYRYIYARYRMKDQNDELKMIQKADIMTMDILCGILSKYTLGGLTKAYLWTQGMENQVFWRAIERAKQIIEFYDVPIVISNYAEEEPAYEEPVAEEIIEEVVEETIEEAVEEVAAVTEEPATEETTEEVVAEEPVVEETTEETLEEAVEEVAAVTEEPAAEETAEETLEEAVEEVAAVTEEPATEETTEEVVAEEPAAEETTEEMVEETATESSVEESSVEESSIEETSQEEISDLGLEDVLESLDAIEAEIDSPKEE